MTTEKDIKEENFKISKLINEDSKTNNYVKVIKDRNANANVV